MRSPILAMLWREWRRSRLSMLLLVLFCGSLSLLCHAIAVLDGSEMDKSSETGLFAGLFIFAFVSTLGRSGGRESQAMPRYFLTLPMGTVTWASIHFLYGAATIALLAFGLTSWHIYLFGAESWLPFGFPPSPWLVAAFFVCIGSLFEGLVLLAGSTGSGVLVVLVAALYLPATIAGMIYLAILDHFQFRSFAAAVWMAGTAVGYLLCLAGVALYRRGTWQGVRAYMLLEAIPELARRRRPFKSPDEAQVWFEWKRFGKYFPIAICCMMGAMIVFWVLVDPSEVRELLDDGSGDPFPTAAVFPILAAVGLGIYMTIRRYWDHTSGFNSFALTLPVSTREMASVRLRAAAGSILISYLAVGAVVCACAVAIVDARNVTYMEIFHLARGILGSVAVCWALLWLAIPLFYALLAGVILVSIVSTTLVYSGVGERIVDSGVAEQLHLGLCIPIAIFVLAVVTAITALRAAKRRELLTRQSVYGMLIMPCLALCSAQVSYSRSLGLSDILFLLCFAATVCLIPAVPFVSVPLSIAWYRHR